MLTPLAPHSQMRRYESLEVAEKTELKLELEDRVAAFEVKI